MQKLLIALAAGSAIGLAAPAAAQYSTQANVNARGAVGIDQRIARLEDRLYEGIRSGAIDRTEARNLRTQLRALVRLERQYSRNGLTQQERADLQTRLRTLRQQFRMADGGGNGRWADNDGDGYNDGYGNQGYGNQGYPNQGGYAGQGGTYEEIEACRDSGRSGGVIGGVIGGILGGRDDCIGVGERAPANLGAVPYELRGQFRDGNGIAYRTDGQRIYQIDVRTNTVLRVYAANR
jgi:hypothetical protein